MKTAIIAAGTALVASAAAANTIKFINRCPYNVYFWTVGPTGSNLYGEDHERTMVPKYGSIIHNMINSEAVGGGLSIKIRDVPHYRVSPAGIVQVEYNLQPSQNSLWYDLSAIDCDKSAGPENPSRCPFIDGGIKLSIPGRKGRKCKRARCVNNICHNTYTEHGSWYNEPTFHCGAGADLVVETCTHNPGKQTHDDKAPHVPSKQISLNGTCGPKTNYTCKGSRWGECCSSYGFCGRSDKYCAAETCNPAYGVCPWNSSGPLNISTEGTCGQQVNFTCKGSKFGQCCSEYGYCGDSDAFCNASTCKEAFGTCPDVSKPESTAVEKPESTDVSKLESARVLKPESTADVEKPESTEGHEDTQVMKSQLLPRNRIIPSTAETPAETTPFWNCTLPIC